MVASCHPTDAAERTFVFRSNGATARLSGSKIFVPLFFNSVNSAFASSYMKVNGDEGNGIVLEKCLRLRQSRNDAFKKFAPIRVNKA